MFQLEAACLENSTDVVLVLMRPPVPVFVGLQSSSANGHVHLSENQYLGTQGQPLP